MLEALVRIVPIDGERRPEFTQQWKDLGRLAKEKLIVGKPDVLRSGEAGIYIEGDMEALEESKIRQVLESATFLPVPTVMEIYPDDDSVYRYALSGNKLIVASDVYELVEAIGPLEEELDEPEELLIKMQPKAKDFAVASLFAALRDGREHARRDFIAWFDRKLGDGMALVWPCVNYGGRVGRFCWPDEVLDNVRNVTVEKDHIIVNIGLEPCGFGEHPLVDLEFIVQHLFLGLAWTEIKGVWAKLRVKGKDKEVLFRMHDHEPYAIRQTRTGDNDWR